MRKFTTTFLFTVLLCFGAYGQGSVYSQYLYWLRYQNQLIFSPSIQWVNEIDNRRFFDPDVQHQLIYHSRLHYKTGLWDFAGGLTYSRAYASRPENGYDKSLAEVRPVVEASHELPLGKFFLHNRFRLDNRFIQSSANASVWESSQFIMRYRYRVQMRVPVRFNATHIPTVTLKVAEEIMLNHTRNTYDQNRLYASGELYLSRNFSLETGYIFIYQQRLGTEDFFSRHVFRFTILHRLYLSSSD